MNYHEIFRLAGWLLAAMAAAIAPQFVGGSEQITDVLKLIVAAGIGHVIVAFRAARREGKAAKGSLEHAQVLLCVAGALMTLIVGSSVARALSIVGVASVVRFRTPVKDPKETTILFLELGLGMCCGMGAYGLAAAGAACICLFLAAMKDSASSPASAAALELAGAKEERR